MRRIFKILLILPLLYLIIIPVWFASSANVKPCGRINICINDSSDYHFVTEQHLTNLVQGSSGRILGQAVKSIKINEIEGRIKTLRELRVAEVYMSIDGTLNVYVDQRNPLVRIMPDEGGDYFMDEEGHLFRKRNLYTPRLHIVQGNIRITPALIDSVSVLDTSIKRTILKDVFHFVNYIKESSFWSAQIDQIYIDGKNEADLIPRVGNHVIHLGTFDDYKVKLRNLEAFYDKVLPEVGWDKYSVINLEFTGQVLGKRRY